MWIAPGGHHMVVRRDGHGVRIVINDDPPENSCRPAVDPLFRSVAAVYGGRALGVIMTGMGQDGLRGIEPLREAGGPVLAQDEATSVVWGMPGFVVARAAWPTRCCRWTGIAPEIVRLVAGGRPATAAGPLATTTARSEHMRILIVDDSRAMRMMVQRVLGQIGLRGRRPSRRPRTASRRSTPSRPARPISCCRDWNMPEMTGIELLRALNEADVKVPFGFVTSESTGEMREQAILAGSRFLIAKPFTPDAFTEALGSLEVMPD